MAKNKLNSISEKELDHLLRKEFLALDFNQPLNNKIMESICNQSAKESIIASSLLNNGLFLKVIIAGTLIAVFSTVYFLSQESYEIVKPTIIETAAYHPEQSITTTANPAEQHNDEFKNTLQESHASKKIESTTLDNKPKEPQEHNLIPVLLTTNENEPFVDIEANQKKGSDYNFPVLTEKEKKNNEKEKKRIGKLAAKLNKNSYPIIKGNNDCGDYYMSSCELSNLDYRTFLFDLLIHGKKEEFLIAKPQQDLWIGAAGKTEFDKLSKVYFSEKKYNEYPVVNISPEGAEMYCKWLTDLARSMKTNAVGDQDLEFRLPDENEWLYAANVGHPDATYPWLNDSIQNNQNRFLANFCIQKLQEKFNRPITYPSKYKINLGVYTSAGAVLNDSTVATIVVYAYNPNDFLLYCMSGNVSELVYKNGTKQLKTKGGNWASDFEHLKLKSEDEFVGNLKPSPMIGFRILAKDKNQK